MNLQRWREARRLHKSIFPGLSLHQCGMAIGALVAAVCVWSEMQRHGPVIAIALGALVAWGAYGAYHSVSTLKSRNDDCERRLRDLGHAPR